MSDIFEEVVEGVRERHDDEEYPDRVYLNLEKYHAVLKETDFASAPTTETSVGRIAGLEVIVVNDLEQELMVLDSAQYPKAQDFKSGDYEPLPLSTRLSYSDV